MEISRLFDSDTETVARVVSDPSTPDPGVATTSGLQRGSNDVNNFSTTARRGSSDNASPMRLSRLQRDRSPINREEERQSESDDDENSDDPADGDASTPYVPYVAAVRRELRRLADHNNPGLEETPSARRTRTRMVMDNKK